jgi:hypothetical protein
MIESYVGDLRVLNNWNWSLLVDYKYLIGKMMYYLDECEYVCIAVFFVVVFFGFLSLI